MLGAQGEGQHNDERDSRNRHDCVAPAYSLRARNDHDEDDCDHRISHVNTTQTDWIRSE